MLKNFLDSPNNWTSCTTFVELKVFGAKNQGQNFGQKNFGQENENFESRRCKNFGHKITSLQKFFD